MADNEQKVMAPPTDAEIVLTIPSDYTAAYMTIYPPTNGGKDVSFESMKAALLAKGVRKYDSDLVTRAVEEKMYDREIKIASAVLPEDGTDGEITYRYEENSVLAPTEDENGFVDYKNLGFIRNIHENDIIADIVLPTPGTDGVDIRGVTIKAIPGRAAVYNLGTGVRLSEDGKTLYAAYNGHICYKNKAFCVETQVTIKGDVDSSVGNIDFLGDVIIKGEVCEGFSITAGGSILVNGNATNAKLMAGNTIVIKHGSINCDLLAHGDIKCDFCEHSKLHTDANVIGNSFVICDVYCGGNLNAKTLNGGKYTVLGDTDVSSIGAKNYVATEIIAGDNAMLNKERELLLKQIAEHNKKIESCTQICDFLNEKRKQLGKLPDDKEELLGISVKTKITSQMEKKKANQRISEIDRKLSQKQFRSVICRGVVYPGVKVTINTASTKFEKETPRVRIYLGDNGEIVTGPV